MSTGLTVFFVLFAVLLVLGAPTYLCMLTASIGYCYYNTFMAPSAMMEKMFISLNNFVLLAIPMFMMAGLIMNCGGIAARIFNFCRAMLGHYRGGLAYVNILASFIFSGMSGSALADVGGLGQIEMAEMEKEGYDDNITLGITAASATMGPIVPPSIPMCIYGSVASVSVGSMFMGGFLPGVVMAIVLSVMVCLLAHKNHYPVHPKASWKERLKAFQESFFALLMPFLILGGIWCGYFTPTEAALVSIVYALIVTRFIYKEMEFSELPHIMVETVEGIGPALTIVSTAALFGWILQFEHFDTWILNSLLGLSQNPTIIILLLDVILLIFGMFIDSTPVIMLMVPVFLPLTRTLGIHEIHLGVVVVLNLMIGLMTPPIGQSLFIMSSVTKKPFSQICRYTSPWLIPLFLCLILISVFPDLVLFLPRLFGML